MEDESNIERLPDLEIAELIFLLTIPNHPKINKSLITAQLNEKIQQQNMYPIYEYICETFKREINHTELERMKNQAAANLKEIEEKIEDAEKNLGDTEVRESLLAKAQFYTQIVHKENALTAFDVVYAKTIAPGQRLDILFYLIKIGFFWQDNELISQNIEKAKILVEQGGDWDRRNRLKVFEALYTMSIRDFTKSGQLFLETLSTFTSYELFSYNTFIFYTVLITMVSLDRVSLKKKVIDSPEILTVILQIPHLSDFLNSFYNSNYKQFFISLAEIVDLINRDRYLSQHARYYCREMRIKAYSQLLESYRSVQLQSMADAFGISVEFLDRELSNFISSGRLHCKIDKVNGVVETNRPDSKNALYQTTIKQGDLLLNRIQKLARVIDL
eukprot:TRINITY_DN190_c1_g2_i1.p1 TRINITY_DN190_c1_g2~~TRINITY_DN190_c1_g2_i1.p1  ORF type:complete len:405 (-),score=145.50 TRINITY_DN190_c1_g2_i1:128-1291(-)